ncbi:c4 zinc finger protein [Mactra antiquata]
MSNANDIGISPVLLQAVSQSLSSTADRINSSVSLNMDMSGATPGNSGAANESLQSQILSQCQDQGEEVRDPNLQSDTIKTMLKLKMAANAITKSYLEGIKSDESDAGRGSASDLAMANVLTALATHGGKNFLPGVTSSLKLTNQNEDSLTASPSLKETEMACVSIGDQAQRTSINSSKSDERVSSNGQHVITLPINSESGVQFVKPEPSVEGTELVDLQTQVVSSMTTSNIQTNITNSSAESSSSFDKINAAGTAILIPESSNLQSSMLTGADSNKGAQLVFSFNPSTGTTESNTERLKVIEHEGKRYIIQTHDFENSSQVIPLPSNQESQSYTVQLGTTDDVPFTSMAEQEVVTVGQQAEEGSGVTIPTYKNVPPTGTGASPCPVCGDNVSGFHYGIFTCESCKGFFKRTVQNKKSFVCPRNGECEIALENRKKCPACRFAKCLVMGMKLEAIRQDRTRGGRSSYGGSSPLEEKKKRPIKIIQRRPSQQSPSSESALASVLNSGTSRPEKPFVPQILTDIMNLESLLCDDDIPTSMSAEDFTMSNPNVFLTLLQLCELKLYKIVRWARNLPYFANISTDDQILLLQNCWCDLLALTLCWKSLQLNNEIVFFHGQPIDLEKASSLDLGEMFCNMLSIVEQFKRLKIDQYECVALKVIILICPDIKGLNDADKLSEQQQRVSIALESYTNSHYRQSPNKYGEILLRLPELARISNLLKDQLMNWMPTNTTSCGLLYELLKGENMRELV